MKKFFLCTVMAVLVTGVFAQEQGKMRGGFNLGYCVPKGGGGVCTDLQLGYNLQDNMNVGIRLGLAAMAKIGPEGENATLAANYNFLCTYAYYFNSGASSFAPFVGGALGRYTFGGATFGNSSVSVDVGPRFGGALSAGFEAKRFRLAAEYNLVPSSPVTVTDNSVEVKNKSIRNSYLTVTFGFYVGGGKWKK